MGSLSFDYIVVGGGTAGLVVAARLAEDPSVNVCVLEAGQDLSDNLDVQVPAFAAKTWTSEASAWTFMTTPQSGANGQSIWIPRGKGLGGSSSINLMQLGRAPAHEYDAFEVLGATGWNSTELSKYLKKSSQLFYSDAEIESFRLKPDKGTHGDGPIANTLPRTCAESWPHFVEACEEVGLPYNPNAIGGQNTGVWPSANAIHPDTAKRVSSATAYYEPVKEQKNLVIITGARVTRILFKALVLGDDLVAEGVEYHKADAMNIVLAKKEVILSAGSILTPQVLELSGIGDQTILQKYGIQPLLHLPGVGKNLRESFLSEHCGIHIINEVYDECETFDVLGLNPERAAKEWDLYQEQQRGMLATIPLHFSFIPLKLLSGRNEIRKLVNELPGTDIHPPSFELLKDWIKSDSDLISQLEIIFVPNFVPTSLKATPDQGKKYICLALFLPHPFARGTVHINGPDPLGLPEVDLSVLDNPVDLALLKDGIRFARKVMGANALKGVVSREILPGPSIHDDVGLEDFIKKQITTSFHPIGTAAMLPRKEGGVVSASLQVYGTKNVRIVDASVIPIHIASHPMATTIALAEKAADLIKASMA